MKKFFKWWHKWVGLVFSVFVILFSISGIVMNHRSLFSSIDISRSFLPSNYTIKNYNNGVIKGTLHFSKDSLLCYGAVGCFIVDKSFNILTDCNDGFDKGVDNRKVCHIVRDDYGHIFCNTLNDVFILDTILRKWQKIKLSWDGERLSDVVTKGDTLFVLSRSYVYELVFPYNKSKRIEIKVPYNYKKEITLFKTVWMLHSGALFGKTGRIVVDILGMILILLSITGIIYFFLPYGIRKRKKMLKKNKYQIKILKLNFKLHKGLGLYLIPFIVLLVFTGMCLRPPLMIPLVLNSTRPLKYTHLDQSNHFHDKLRAIRWDGDSNSWLLSTSEGFYRVKDLEKDTANKINSNISVSPMGINVFEQNEDSTWLIGSFVGMFVWDIQKDKITDYFTHKAYKKNKGRPIGRNMISGFSKREDGKDIIFTYDRGALTMLPQNDTILKKQPMSLWNCALEVHSGRLYFTFFRAISDLFIFLSGLASLLILISGFLIIRKRKIKQQKKDFLHGDAK